MTLYGLAERITAQVMAEQYAKRDYFCRMVTKAIVSCNCCCGQRQISRCQRCKDYGSLLAELKAL